MPVGSPPRGRGRPGRAAARRPAGGLTPARAGTASSSSPAPGASRAHPRAGGDGRPDDLRHGAGEGSPPRGRGRQGVVREGQRAGGLTPARAGTVARCPRRAGCGWAHPRAGGDGASPSSPFASPTGSPPRGRGRHPRLPESDLSAGLTPARAGTASRTRPRSLTKRAHPRAGGDGPGPPGGCCRTRGSPPRGRGRQADLIGETV